MYIYILPYFYLISFLPQGHVIYTASAGYIMSRGPGGAPVAIPVQAGGGMVAVQTVTPGAQGDQPQMVMVPVSGAQGYQPHLVQGAQPESMSTGNQPLRVDMPPPYSQEEYMT